jgi:mono/diheme cytochrome c family protein
MIGTAADTAAINDRHRRTKQMRRSLAVILAMALPALPAAAQNPPVGRSLAVRWCMACHVVEPNQSMATDNAPSFRAIAARPDTTARSLDRYLSTGHTLMPDFWLSSQERDALVAYILSLR